VVESDFDELDRRLVHARQINGRAPFSTIAEVLGVSDRTIARRYARLRSAGAVRVLGGVDPTALGAVLWFLRVRCAPAASVPVAEALARRPDTSWVSITSGGTEITCTVRTESEADSEALLLAKLPHPTRGGGDRALRAARVLRRPGQPGRQARVTRRGGDRTAAPVLEEAGAALAGHPEIAFAAATTGPTNLFASVVCANQRELYRYLTTRVAALPAIAHVEAAPVIKTVKRAANRT
jgi:DNA-binding Lrp family transcriptional regulator